MTWISALEFYIISTSFGGTLLVCLWYLLNKLFNRIISINGTYLVFKSIILFYFIPIVYWGRFYDMASDEELLSSVPIIGLINPHMNKILFFPFMVWLIGAVIVFLYTIYSYLYFYFNVMKYNALVVDQTILEKQKQINQQLKLKKSLPIYYNEAISSPMLAGVLFPKILLPSSFPKEDLTIMLYHETIHYKQRDLLFKQLGNVILCLHWFNPFVHKLTKLINEWCEFNCDNLCCLNHNFFSPKDYAKTLLSLATSPRTSFHLNYSAFSEKTSRLEPRIRKIATQKKTFKHARLLAIFICSIFFFLGSITVNAASNEVLSYYYDWYYNTSTYIKEEACYIPNTPLITQSADEAIESSSGIHNAPDDNVSDIMPSYFWKVKKNNGINCIKIDCKAGQILYISNFIIQQDLVLHHGIIDLDGNIHYVDGSSFVVFNYRIPKDGEYTIFVQNPTNEDVNINGTYHFE